MFNNQIIAGSSGQGGGFYSYTIDQSLRFNDNDSAYLNRTFASAGNQQIWTWSGWVKRGNLASGSAGRNTIFSGSGTQIFGFMNPTTNATADNFGCYLTDSEDDRFMTNRVFRDVNSWYHLVVTFDSTAATNDDRFRLWVNGVQETSWSRFDTITQNRTTGINAAAVHAIGVQANASSQYFDGYLAEVHFIDGTALDATSFGETINGVWVPKQYSGSYGTNGFYLSFADSAAIGDDLSGNTNDFTATNLAASDVVPDSPTNNFATWNTLDKYNYNAPSEGNLRALTAGNNGTQAATFAVSSGKWYFEARNGTAGSGTLARFVGIGKEETNLATTPYNNVDNYLYYSPNGNSYNGGTSVAYGDAWQADGDIIGVAFDADNGAIWFSKNGTWQNSATAAEIAAGTTTNAAFTGLSGTFVPIVAKTGGTSSNDPHHANFGQDSTFAGATTAGGNADANGYGDFKYAPPSGFLALCSANMTEPAIGPNSDTTSDQHFVPYLYTADGTTPKSRTGIGFTPNFLWFKDRTTSFSHALYDTVRGTNKGLQTNSTSAENSYTLLTSFDADGFTTTNDGTVGNLLNNSTDAYVTWAWKAGGNADTFNIDDTGYSTASAAGLDGGDITPTGASVNTTAGISIITYTGTGATSATPLTINHGLGKTPSMIILKDRDVNSNNAQWIVGHTGLATNGYIYLSATNAASTSTSGTVAVSNADATNFALGVAASPASNTVNESGDRYVAYLFADVEGHLKCGSYEGNSSASDGPFVYTGFRPSFVMGKAIDQTGRWWMYDSARTTYNDGGVNNGRRLEANSSSAESTADSSNMVEFYSNGFKVNTTNSEWNGSGLTYIYLAFAEAPFKYANAR